MILDSPGPVINDAGVTDKRSDGWRMEFKSALRQPEGALDGLLEMIESGAPSQIKG